MAIFCIMSAYKIVFKFAKLCLAENIWQIVLLYVELYPDLRNNIFNLPLDSLAELDKQK
jgi:hypothetical protein